MHDLITPLEHIKLQLAENRVNTSDALLVILNCLRPIVSSEQTAFLNRELLGYSHEDVVKLAAKCSSPASLLSQGDWHFSKCNDPTIDRVLPGLKVKISQHEDGTISIDNEVHASTIFCANGIIEIEQLLSNNAELYSAVDFDEATSSVFMCKTRHLRNLNDALKKKICRFLDDILTELKMHVDAASSMDNAQQKIV